MKTNTIRISIALLATFALAAPAFAGGPLANCRSGQPFLWPNGGSSIPFNPDQGDLGPLTGPDAVALVGDAFAVWADVPTSTARYTNAGLLPVDVDITNFLPFLNPTAPDGLSAIVFDDTGEIFDLLFGPGSGVLGFAGPEWGNTITCTILEGVSFLNGPAFDDLDFALDVMVHEFGHYTNLAHTVVNGQIFIGDTSGPTPDNTFGFPAITDVETLYPFYFGTGSGIQTLEADDVAALSTLYPEPGFFANSGTITGTILASNGITKLTGVNVIARNLADPFADAVSALSSDFTDSTSQSDPFTGVYTLNGLTPGAQYAVFVDQILAGGFSTTPLVPLPGPEEFWNGAGESGDATTDDPLVLVPVTTAAGSPVADIDILFNAVPGVLDLGDDDNIELPLPFTYTFCGQDYDSVFVNSNGSLSFGAGSNDFSESASDMLGGPPRIAGVWDDLNPSRGGVVSFAFTSNRFTVTFTDVPEFFATGANTFEFTLKKDADEIEIVYGDLSARDGLAGVSCGGAVNLGNEPESVLVTVPNSRTINMNGLTAFYEIFTSLDNDLDGYRLKFTNLKKPFADDFEPNDSIADATPLALPFDTGEAFTAIDPVGGDVDYFAFSALGGTTLICEVTAGSLDSLIGLFDAGSGVLLAIDDDGGAGLLSRLVFPVTAGGDFALAVTTFPDSNFDGNGNSGGRYALSCQSIQGLLIDLGDDDNEEIALGFSFPYQGLSYTSVFVNSNGNLTFGSGDNDFSESVSEFLNETPRIAMLWDDLSPNQGGLVFAETAPGSITITFDGVPQFLAGDSNTFSVTLASDGSVTIVYGAVSANDGIVGVTQGGGTPDPGETDLSAGGPFSATGTTYEQFTSSDPFDLDGVTLEFLP